ncbi:MAG: hypothetical protein JNJ91_09545 [Flavobacteriales bacterium]|nr:hypothetical protein [Flavobacteriales bacterium]
MTIKEAILKSLQELGGLATHIDVLEHIKKNRYCDFGGPTPQATVSAELGSFVRNGDSRVKRIKKQEGGGYFYYLTANESQIGVDVLAGEKSPVTPAKSAKVPASSSNGKTNTYYERDLHKLLSTYLQSIGVLSKTIFHEQSKTSDDGNQTWTHPDMVGISFLKLQTPASQEFLKVVNHVATFKLSSYEIKKELNSDAELKKAFFQAVSNSSWANYGYLVAFEISDGLKEEIERLNQSFGIGVIELNPNPYYSRVIHQARHRELDFKTIDKLCKINKDFNRFIEQTEKLLTAEVKYRGSAEKELTEFCDVVFTTDAEIEQYCKEKHIPWETYIQGTFYV